MPRQRSGARPTAPARPAPAPMKQQPSRPATTYAPSSSSPTAPTSSAAPPTSAPSTPSAGPGLFGQMAATATGVAVGSTVGHVIGAGITGLFGGSGSSDSAQTTEQQPQAAAQTNNNTWGNNCSGATQQFTKCMDDNGGNMQICGWYLEQLKACQQAASQY